MRPSAISMWGEDVCGRELFLLALRHLVLVWGERGDVDQPGNAFVGSRGGDDGSAVRVANEDGRDVDPPQGTPDRGDVAFE
jgi:hypothetical protein